MGFDIYIRINMMLDKHTGLPVVWSRDANRLVPYEPSKWMVPEEHRRWIEQRGSHFHMYITGDPHICVEQFLEAYPCWEMIEGNLNEDDVWCEQDHHAFRSALEWFRSKGGFSVDWSY